VHCSCAWWLPHTYAIQPIKQGQMFEQAF